MTNQNEMQNLQMDEIDELSDQFDHYSDRLNQLKIVTQDYLESLNEKLEALQNEFTSKWNETKEEVSQSKIYIEKSLAEIFESTDDKIVKKQRNLILN